MLPNVLNKRSVESKKIIDMIKYKVRELAGGSTQTKLRLFGVICWACLIAKNSGWFRIFGIGTVSYTHC